MRDCKKNGLQIGLLYPLYKRMKKLSGEIPHPNGPLSASYLYNNNQWQIDIILPKSVSGYLIWMGEKIVLKEGKNIKILKRH